MATDAADAPHSRVFHVLEVCRVAGAHKQALANHACVQSSIKTMSASVHEAEVLLNAAVIDLDEPGARASCLPDDDPRVGAIVSVMDQDGTGKGLVSLRNVAAERYWGTRWKREWQAKYHDPLVEIRRQEREDAAMGGLDASMQRRREQRVRTALKDLVKKPEFDPILRARGRAQEFVSLRRKGQGGRCLGGGRPRTAFGATNKPAASGAQQAVGKRARGGDREQGRRTALPLPTAGGKLIQASPLAPAEPPFDRRRRCRSATFEDVPRAGTRGNLTFGTSARRFPGGTGWDAEYTARALSRLAKVDQPVRDYTEGALDSTRAMGQAIPQDRKDFSAVLSAPRNGGELIASDQG